jgi:hypothetical protein
VDDIVREIHGLNQLADALIDGNIYAFVMAGINAGVSFELSAKARVKGADKHPGFACGLWSASTKHIVVILAQELSKVTRESSKSLYWSS